MELSRSLSHIAIDVHHTVHTNKDVQERISCPFYIEQQTLTTITREKNLESLTQLGGVEHLASALRANKTNGISTNCNEMLNRKTAFGSNVYLKPPNKSFLSFVVEALRERTVILLLGCAVFLTGFGIEQNGLKRGWYDGLSITITTILVVLVSTVKSFTQSRPLEELLSKNSNKQADVLRDGLRSHVSIFDIVVGDIVFLKPGDQIPADGLLLDGDSLKVDESSIASENGYVQVNYENNPFLFSGTIVADGFGSMLVTSVGMNTTWGKMMSSIMPALVEKTPLQTHINKLTTSIVSLKNSCQPDLLEAVKTCRKAKIGVKMITGDNLFTAKAIGLECGILTPEEQLLYDKAVIEGTEFRSWSHEERMQNIDQIRVMARSSPSDKLLMIQCLKVKGHVLAVAGDGASHAAVQVSKESSGLVILDDNFTSIMTSLRWSRCAFSNIQKIIQFQLVTTFVAHIVNIVITFSSGKAPLLRPNNLVIDTLGALALSTEPPTDYVVNKPPFSIVLSPSHLPITNYINIIDNTINASNIIITKTIIGKPYLIITPSSTTF